MQKSIRIEWLKQHFTCTDWVKNWLQFCEGKSIGLGVAENRVKNLLFGGLKCLLQIIIMVSYINKNIDTEITGRQVNRQRCRQIGRLTDWKVDL